MGCLRYDILGCLLRNCFVSLLWIRPTDPTDKYSRAWKQLDRSTPKGYEVEIARRVPDTACSKIQPGAPQCDVRSSSHCGEALAQLHSQLDKVPRRPLLVSTTANQ